MVQGNQIKVISKKLYEFIVRRPILMPAVLMLIFFMVFLSLRSAPALPSFISCQGRIRHIELKADGSADVEINTSLYGRLLYKGFADDGFMTGDTVFIDGSVKTYSAPSNPGQFDYADYLRRKGISGVLQEGSVKASGGGSFVCKISDRINRLFYKIRLYTLSCFDEEDRALAAALFTGDSSLVDDDLSRDFRLSNCSHLLAVSGTHFAGFLVILSGIFSDMKVKHKYSSVIHIIFCILIGTFTGWSESVTRAAVISICSVCARDYLSALSLASIIILVSDPYSCLSSGFQMSFMASLSIKMFSGRIGSFLMRLHMPSRMAETLTPVFAATLGMMPFWTRTCYYFSFVHLAVQILASVLATFACVFFIPTVLTGLPFACSFIFKLLRLIMHLSSLIAFEGPSSRGLTPMFLYASFAFLFLLLMPQGIIRRYILPPSSIILMISLGFMAASYFKEPSVRVVFIDVGQGDSCLIMSEGRSLLIDGGVESQGRYSLVPVLDYYGISSVDLAVASHMDSDHKGGLDYLNEHGRIRRLLTCYDLCAGDGILMTGELKLYCVWPYTVTDGGNGDSVVLRLEYGGHSILFTGDIGFDVENELIRQGADIDADILKVAHHGSAYSTSTEFLEEVSPETAVISVEENSPYGHPAPSTLERLEDYGCEIRMTALEGAVIYEFQ